MVIAIRYTIKYFICKKNLEFDFFGKKIWFPKKILFLLTLNVENPNMSTKKLIKSHTKMNVYTSAGIRTIELHTLDDFLWKKSGRIDIRMWNRIQNSIWNTHGKFSFNRRNAWIAFLSFFVNVQIPICFSTDLQSNRLGLIQINSFQN